MKKIIAIIIAVFVCALGVIPAFAADSSVEYNNAREFVFNPQGGNLFQNFEGVMPGDKETQDIVIKNTKAEYPITVYLKAEIANEYKEFLDYIDLTVYYSKTKDGEKTQIQSGRASEEGNLITDVKLGTYTPNESGYITVSIYVHPEMDNQYKSSIGKIKWIFTVEEGEKITKPTTEVTTNEDGFIPGTRPSPQTGVTFAVGFIAIGVIVIAVIILVVLNKKKDDKDDSANSAEKKDNTNET